MSAVIRLADRGDIERLKVLRFDYFKEEHMDLTEELHGQIEAQLGFYFQEHLNKDFFAALAEVDGSIAAVAFLAVSEKPANPSFPTGKTGTVLNVLTYPKYRRRGYATQALKLLIIQGQRLKLSYLELSASEMGRPVYRKLGFGERDFAASAFTEMRLPLL